MSRIITSCGVFAAFCVLLLSLGSANAQGTITFDGPPLIPPGSARVVQSYHESGVWFAPIPGTDGFIRQGSNPPAAFWPDNGTAHVVASLGDSLMFGLDDGSEFGLSSVDLAEWSTDYPEAVSVRFIGYKPDGSTITTELVTDGIFDGTGPLPDFETLYFDSRFTGFTRVQIPTTGWSLDNLVVTIPKPSVPLWITDITQTNNQTRLTWSGGSGRYQLLRTTDLASGVWENVGDPTTETTATVGATNAVEFFRVQVLP